MAQSIDSFPVPGHGVLVLPQPAGDVAFYLLVLVVTGLVGLSLFRLRATNGTFLLVLISALAASQMEGWAEYMAMQYQPEVGSRLAYRAWNQPIPVHIVLSYAVYFGGPGYAILRAAEAGVNARYWRNCLTLLGTTVFLADILAVNVGVWTYYGRQSFMIFGVPLVWMFCNVAAIFGFIVTAHLCLTRLRGYCRLLTIAIGPVGLSMTWGGVALPIGNVLHSDAGPVAMMLAALASMIVSSCIIWLAVQYLSSVKGLSVLGRDSKRLDAEGHPYHRWPARASVKMPTVSVASPND